MLLPGTSVFLSISCLLEMVDQTMNGNVKVIEKLPEESSVEIQWKESECGPVPSESEQSGSYPNHLVRESEERECVHLTEWGPSFHHLCSNTVSTILQPGTTKPWRLYPRILYPRQLRLLIPFAISSLFLSYSFLCLVFSLSNLITPLPSPSSLLQVSVLPHCSIWQEAGWSHFIHTQEAVGGGVGRVVGWGNKPFKPISSDIFRPGSFYLLQVL